jgi:hypothetical protein
LAVCNYESAGALTPRARGKDEGVLALLLLGANAPAVSSPAALTASQGQSPSLVSVPSPLLGAVCGLDQALTAGSDPVLLQGCANGAVCTSVIRPPGNRQGDPAAALPQRQIAALDEPVIMLAVAGGAAVASSCAASSAAVVALGRYGRLLVMGAAADGTPRRATRQLPGPIASACLVHEVGGSLHTAAAPTVWVPVWAYRSSWPDDLTAVGAS